MQTETTEDQKESVSLSINEIISSRFELLLNNSLTEIAKQITLYDFKLFSVFILTYIFSFIFFLNSDKSSQIII